MVVANSQILLSNSMSLSVRMHYKLGLKLFPTTAYGHAINDISYNFHHNLSHQLPEK